MIRLLSKLFDRSRSIPEDWNTVFQSKERWCLSSTFQPRSRIAIMRGLESGVFGTDEVDS